MRNLVRPLLRMFGRDDRGAVGVLLAVLIGGGVLLGMSALAIDVGRIYQNRAELQNGADGGALAAARQCALGTCAQSSALSTAVDFAKANASALTGHSNGVYLVCGSNGLGACSSITGSSLTDCPPDPTNGVSFVDVQTETKLPSGSTLLPPVFAQTLVGGSSYDGTTVKACAQAEWGYAEQSDSLAITISLCEWQNLTSAGSPYGTFIPIYIKGQAKPCTEPTPGGGLNIPGGFDWLQTTSGCNTYINLTTDTTYSNTGNNVEAACKTALVNLVNSYLAGNPVTVFVPVFGCPASGPVPGCPYTSPSQTSASTSTYYIIGLASLVVTGYANMPGMDQVGAPNSLGDYSTCLGTTTPPNTAPCIEGYFKPGLDPVADYPNPNPAYPGLDALTVKLTG